MALLFLFFYLLVFIRICCFWHAFSNHQICLYNLNAAIQCKLIYHGIRSIWWLAVDCPAYIAWTKCIFIGRRSIQSIANGIVHYTNTENNCIIFSWPFHSVWFILILFLICVFVCCFRIRIETCSFGLELHIVSHDQRYQNFSIAVQNRKGVAVLGVLFHVADDVNPVLKNILDSAERIREAVGESSLIDMPLTPAELLPPDRLSYYRYEGSLTTPSCDEAVIWTIFDKSIPFAMTQIERFKQVKDPDGNLLTHNFRQLQRLNSRPLVYVRDDNSFYIHSAASAIQTISAGLIFTIILMQMVQ